MRPLLALLATSLLGLILVACGGSGNTSSTRTSSAQSVDSTTAATSTADTTTPQQNAAEQQKTSTGAATTGYSTQSYGHAASAAQKRAVTTLVKRYYATAAAENGAKACSMLDLDLAESAAEDYGHGSAGPSFLKAGKSCPTVMKLLFAHLHGQLAAELPRLDVAGVRVSGRNGFALLKFGTPTERRIAIVREGRNWKIEALLDSELT